ncbi:stage II sporulation protein R [Muricomes intestini]|jgi:stage II sporulation protein R|uniref:Stage II sporulation protein R n=1 Tax=Muricomes intestini TaxID=1796634 RepID=A0A4R3KGL1_9FIRM|nr:stage II sporulation protein R [Muricomes intestini]TCS82325.1 stage II sporulation protein R [Muricomes intestini]HAX52883.1 stage II sporulation protein R [Lachnospiraceae bacterium]
MDRTDSIYCIDKHTNRIILILAIIIASFITGVIAWHMNLTAQAKLQEHLAQEVLRFHILANSDSEEDQALKMDVKEQVLAFLKNSMPDGMDVEETEEWMRRNTDKLEETGKKTILLAGKDYPVSAAVTTCYFPEKTYGDVTFPAGNYKALRIEIGAAKGHNWWCVLYPNLCFTDATNAVVPEEGKEELKNVLTEEEYSKVTAQLNFKIKWYFLDKFDPDTRR